MLRKGLALLLSVLLAAAPLCADAATLDRGSRNGDVLKLKQRMFELGYFKSEKFSNEYNGTTAERVRQLQKNNGLPQTGAVDEALWALIFSDACVAADGTVKAALTAAPAAEPAPEIPVPAPEPAATAAGPVPAAPTDRAAPLDVPGAPERNAEGFLTAEDEFVVQDYEGGFWAYLSGTLQVVIHRYWDETEKVYWFACDIRTAGDERIRSLNSGGKYLYPRALARSHKAVIAINDDNHDYRINQKQAVGIVIRDGKVLSKVTKKPTQGGFPKLETLACFADGSMKCYNAQDLTAEEYLEKGADHVLAFGPILVTDGHLGEHMRETEAEAKKANFYHYREPRIALGMVAPGHYLIVNVTGRYKDKRAQIPGATMIGSKNGVYLDWVALRMLELGATEAINLDGGWTTALCFLGENLNMKYSSSRKTRWMMGFGVSDLCAQD